MAASTILTILLGISVFFNFVFWVRIQQLSRELEQVKGGVQLTREELEQLKVRLERLKGVI